MDFSVTDTRKRNPKENAGIFSYLTFLYTSDIFKRSAKRDLEENDIYEVTSNFKSSELGDELEKQWNIAKIDNPKPSLARLLWKCFGMHYLLLGIMQLIVKTTVVSLQPKALGKLVAYFKPGQTELSKEDAYYYGGILVALSFFNCIYNHNYMLLITNFGIKVRTAFSSLIYRKALKLSSASLSQISVGKVVTLMSKDAFAFETAFVFMNDMWIGVFQVAIVTYLLYNKIGPSCFAGMGFFLLIIPLQLYIGKKTSQVRISTSKKTDARIQVTQETVSAIKIIKMYTWEPFFSKVVSKARQEELTKLRNIYYLKALTMVTGALNSSIAFYILIMTYIWMGNNITAEIVFFIMGCFHTLRSFIMISIPLGIAQGSELLATLQRLAVVFYSEELKEKPILQSTIIAQPKVYLKNVSVKIGETDVLRDISLSAESGLHVLTGPVGGGKSSILKTILKEYPVTSGKFSVEGTLSYASEEPWLFPSTVKQNILFGANFDETRYNEVLRVCALTMDINSFEEGDNTIVGDCGVNLSKGQQARVNLARTIYRDRDIYLLDDCLTALDSQVNKFVFQECIKGFLKNKICILVTHNVNHIKQTRNITLVEYGATLNLERQRAQLDKRITYYMDDVVDYESDGEINEDENEKLLKEDSTITKNIYHEEKKTGKVDFSVYKKYFSYSGGIIVISLLFALFVVAQFTTSVTEKLVSSWVNSEQNLSDLIITNQTNTTKYEVAREEHDRILKLYTIMMFASVGLNLMRAYFHFFCTSRASVNLHNSMLSSVLNARMEFFDTHYVGNILNRFSKDLANVDEYLPFIIYECLRLVCFLIGAIVVIATINWYFMVPAVFVFCIMFYFRKRYLPAGRSLRRLDASTRSPIVGYINASLEGITTIRANGNDSIIRNEFDRHQDLFTSAYYMGQCTGRAFGFWLDMLCSTFISVIILSFLFLNTGINVGDVGLAITQATMLTGLLQWAIRQWAELENNMTSVERVNEYTTIRTENSTSGIVPINWPREGKIVASKVSLTYTTTQENVLKNLNFTIEAGNKVGIVGRTGAGKSSIIASLFRLYDIQGKIVIDGVDIKTVSLQFLRSSIAIIPQDPVLFTGTIRANIDPMNKYTDKEIWDAIHKVGIKSLIGTLENRIFDGGLTYSSGQRQLICLARALVSKNRIVILDEATANMDPETDDLLHRTIAENFAKCTVVTIAHRLHSVLKSDMVLVMDHGEIVEYDTPEKLLENQEGVFTKLVRQAGLH